MRELQSMLGDQVRPLNDHLSTMDNTKAPDFDTYANWLTRQIILSKREAQGAWQVPEGVAVLCTAGYGVCVCEFARMHR